MKTLRYCFAAFLVVTALGHPVTKFEKYEDDTAELTVLVFSHRIETLEGFRAKDHQTELYFLETAGPIESYLLEQYKYSWLKPRAAFEYNKQTGTYRLKDNPSIQGSGISVGGFEKTPDGVRGILTTYSAPLGCSSMRYYLKQKANGAWFVEKAVWDRELPVS